jgi:hypothetical protein
MPLLLQNPQKSSHGCAARRIRNGSDDIVGRGFAARINDVHNLPFAAAEIEVGGLRNAFTSSFDRAGGNLQLFRHFLYPTSQDVKILTLRSTTPQQESSELTVGTSSEL